MGNGQPQGRGNFFQSAISNLQSAKYFSPPHLYPLLSRVEETKFLIFYE